MHRRPELSFTGSEPGTSEDQSLFTTIIKERNIFIMSVVEHHVYVHHPKKSIGTAVLLSGPLGMLYSTVVGAFVMFIVNLLAIFGTFGLGLLFTWPLCIVWAAVAANSTNNPDSQ
jgi:hypothetical protein